MEGSPCKRSRTNDDAVTGGGDRLSALPDCLLHEIMCRMQARQVVQTCVLSTRWRRLWRSVPCIDADEGEFAAVPREASSSEKFEDFMDTLLSPGNVSIALLDKFRLRVTSLPHDYEEKRGYRWIRRGIKYDGAAAPAQGLGIQRQSFTWRLRKLHLNSVDLDALFSEHVGSGCPNLEDLDLTGCKLVFHAITSGSLKNLVMKDCRMRGFREITSPTLNNLVIDGCRYVHEYNCPLVVITAPAAASVFLGIVPRYYGDFSVREVTPLAKVSVRLQLWGIRDHLKILGGVSDVMTNLELDRVEASVPGEWSAKFPQFNRLRALELSRCDLSDGFKTLGLFLRNSPNLERLTLWRCKYSNDSKKRRSSKSKNTEPTPCPNLLDAPCKSLRLTEIIYQDQDIRQLIDLLLRISENIPNNCIKLIKK